MLHLLPSCAEETGSSLCVDPRLKIKEDLLHKLSRDHQLEGGREGGRGGVVFGAEESREAPGRLGKQVRGLGTDVL